MYIYKCLYVCVYKEYMCRQRSAALFRWMARCGPRGVFGTNVAHSWPWLLASIRTCRCIHICMRAWTYLCTDVVSRYLCVYVCVYAIGWLPKLQTPGLCESGTCESSRWGDSARLKDAHTHICRLVDMWRKMRSARSTVASSTMYDRQSDSPPIYKTISKSMELCDTV